MRGPSDKKQFAKWCEDEAHRIEQQRTLFAMLPDTAARDRFKQAMLDRAWELLDSGGPEGAEACDALLEFLPSADTDALLAEYFKEDAND